MPRSVITRNALWVDGSPSKGFMMSLTVGELRQAIADSPDDATVMMIHEGRMCNVVATKCAPNGKVAVIRSKGNTRQSKPFSVAEDGLIGGLLAMGMSDESTAELLERSVSSIKRRKKTIGLC